MDRRQFLATASATAALAVSPAIAGIEVPASVVVAPPLPVNPFLQAEVTERVMTADELMAFRRLCPMDYGTAWAIDEDGTRRSYSLPEDPVREAQIEAFWKPILERWHPGRSRPLTPTIV